MSLDSFDGPEVAGFKVTSISKVQVKQKLGNYNTSQGIDISRQGAGTGSSILTLGSC